MKHVDAAKTDHLEMKVVGARGECDVPEVEKAINMISIYGTKPGFGVSI